MWGDKSALKNRVDLLENTLSQEEFDHRVTKRGIRELKNDIAARDSMNKALAEQNRDLVWQLELYKAVLAQLSIPIKLPARKS